MTLDKNFWDIAPKTQCVKEQIDKLDFVKINSFCCLKDIVKRIKSQMERKHLWSMYWIKKFYL